MYQLSTSLVVVKAFMAFSAVFAAGVMFRRTRNVGWLVFVIWILLATSYIFEQCVDPLGGGGTPANMIPKWKRNWWSTRTYLDPLALAISVILIAVGRRDGNSIEETGFLRIIIGWLAGENQGVSPRHWTII